PGSRFDVVVHFGLTQADTVVGARAIRCGLCGTKGKSDARVRAREANCNIRAVALTACSPPDPQISAARALSCKMPLTRLCQSASSSLAMTGECRSASCKIFAGTLHPAVASIARRPTNGAIL